MSKLSKQILSILLALVIMLSGAPYSLFSYALRTSEATDAVAEESVVSDDSDLNEEAPEAANDIEDVAAESAEETEDASAGAAAGDAADDPADSAEDASADKAAEESAADAAAEDAEDAAYSEEAESIGGPAQQPDTQTLTATLGDAVITVKADAGTLPDGTVLKVSDVTDKEQTGKVTEALDLERKADRKIASSYTFDIKLLDANNNEIQPAEGSRVEVTFDLPEASSSNLEADIYHIRQDEVEVTETEAAAMDKSADKRKDTEKELVDEVRKRLEENRALEQEDIPKGEETVDRTLYTAEPLEVDTKDEETVAVETDGFSYYTVEFTYGNLQYVLSGDDSVSLKTILETVGLTGDVTAVEVSSSELFSASDKTGEWIITSHKAFTSKEWIKVTIDDVVYEITVTDYNGTIDNDSVLSQNGITQGGDSGVGTGSYDGTPTFASGMKIANISIGDLKNITPNITYVSGASNGTHFQTDTSAKTIRLRAGSTGGGSADYGLWYTLNVQRYCEYDDTIYIRYAGGAKLADGTAKDVLIKYENIKLYVIGTQGANNIFTSGINKQFNIFSYENGPTVRASVPSTGTGSSDQNNNRYGMIADVSVSIVESGTTTPTAGNFIYTTYGLDAARPDGTQFHSLYNAGSYQSYIDGMLSNRSSITAPIDDDSDNMNYSEAVKIDKSASSLISDIYIPAKDHYAVLITDGGKFVAAGGAGSINPAVDNETSYHNNYDTGFAVMADSSGSVVTKAWSSSYYKYDGPEANTSNNKDDARDIYILPGGVSHTSTSSSDTNGTIAVWDDGTVDSTSGSLLYKGAEVKTYDVPNGKAVTYKMMPDSGYVLNKLTVNGSEVSATDVDTDGDGEANYYTYTFDSSVSTAQTIHVTWKKAATVINTNCSDCKNPASCTTCYDYLNNGVQDYNKETDLINNKTLDKVLRGGDARSGTQYLSGGYSMTNNLDSDDDTFADILPYGNIFIDTDKLRWDSSNNGNYTIDIPSGSPFVWAVSGDFSNQSLVNNFTDANGKHPDLVLGRQDSNYMGSDYNNITHIAYYGPIHSYLRYGSESDGALTSVERDNTAAIPANIANGTYTVGGQTVNVVNGTNVIEAAAGSYLYKITYKDAAILFDGTRADLVLTTTKVEIESSSTPSKLVYVGVQGANDMDVIGTYTDLNGQYCFDASNTITRGYTNSTVWREIRHAIGNGVTFDVSVQDANGNPIDGTIAYAIKDLDGFGYDSYWGRAPLDHNTSYTEADAGYYWEKTSDFYSYAEGLEINKDDMKSYALVPTYNGAYLTAATAADGKIPIDEVRRQLGKSTEYKAPLQAIDTTNGIKFVSTSAEKARNATGDYASVAYGYYTSATSYNYSFGRSADYTNYSPEMKYNSSNTWTAGRMDNNTYDSGFAALIDASGTTMRWTGSQHTTSGAVLNTTLFEASFASRVMLSHGTGGGIYAEDYDINNNCETIMLEGLVTLPATSSLRTTIVPEDGYRVRRITVDDVVITVDEANDQIYYTDTSGTMQSYNLTSGGTVSLSLSTSNGSGSSGTLDLEITRNTNGIYDVLVSNRGGYTVKENNIHADFETDYYFQKIWEGGAANEQAIPDKLYITAVPYVTKPDSVTIDGTTFEIKEQLNASGGLETVFTDVTDPNNPGTPIVLKENDPNSSNASDHLQYISSSKHPARAYPQVIDTANNITYVLMGNDLYKTKVNATTGLLEVVEDSTSPATVRVRLERYEDDTYIHQTDFVIRKDDAIANGTLIEKQTSGGDVIWRIKYPDAGVDWNTDSLINDTASDSDGDAYDWLPLPLEVEDITQADSTDATASNKHHVTTDHVERIYWFAMEDIDKLSAMWLLEDYINEYDNEAAVMPGIASYERTDTSGATSSYFENRAYWYVLSTKDHEDVTDQREDMANIQMAVMTPLSDQVKDKKTTASSYDGYGGKIINRIIETKLKVNKVWIGDEQLDSAVKQALRNKLDITIKRTYHYQQPRVNDSGQALDDDGNVIMKNGVPVVPTTITLPTGTGWNTVMKNIAGGAANITAFRRESEPLLTDKLEAQTNHTVDAAGNPVSGHTCNAGDMVYYQDATTGAELYIWYDSATGSICYWTDAESDYIFLNANSEGMFKDLTALSDISGCEAFNTSNVTTMKEMFAVTSGSTGSLVSLDYLRKWDTENVTDLTEMFANQAALTNIKGIIDWNVDNVSRPTTADPTASNNFENMFKSGSSTICDDKTVPFIFFPRFFIKSDGDIDITNSTNASDDANDLLYLDDDLTRSGDTVANHGGIGGIYKAEASDGTNFMPVLLGDKWDAGTTYYSDTSGTSVTYANQTALDTALAAGTAVYTKVPDNTWVWVITELLSSDSAKWDYKIYEDAMVEYKNLEGAVTFANRKDIKKNTTTGYLEYTLTNKLALYDFTVKKTVEGNTGSRDRYFKYTIDFPSILPGHVLELDGAQLTVPTSNLSDTPNDATVYTNKEIADANGIDMDNTTSEQEIICNTGYIYNGTTYSTLADVENAGGSEDDCSFACKIKYYFNSNEYSTEAEAQAAVDTWNADSANANNQKKYATDITSAATAKLVFYVRDGQEFTIKEVPYSTAYIITEETASGYKTWSVDGNGDNKISGVTSTGTSGITAELSDSGTYYKLKDKDTNGNDQYEEVSDYYAEWVEGTTTFDTLTRYIYEDGQYKVHAKGKYYKLTNGLYGNISPYDRYDSLDKKYTLNVTRAYTNRSGTAIPTEVRLKWPLMALVMILMALAWFAYVKYKKHKEAMGEL